MSDTYLITNSIGEWRTALVDSDEVPVEVTYLYDAALDPTDVVYAARVTKIDKTLEMAFITLPDGSSGMLNYRRAKSLAKSRGIKQPMTISDCVTEGELVSLQALGAPSVMEDKATPMSGKVKVVGRYLVVESGKGRLNLSKDLPPHVIGGIKKALQPLAEDCAIVVRSHAANVPVQALVAEATWITEALNQAPAEPAIIFAPSALERALLHAPEDVDVIMIEGGDNFARSKQLCSTRWPDLSDKISLYKGDSSAFEFYGVEEAIEEAVADKIDLPSGGWIAVYETPALTAIDVNMGSAMSGQSAAEAKRVVNLEAALAAAFHMRFQNMGGLIVVDFIDNAAKGAVAEMMRYLERALADDNIPVHKSGMSSFGLMQFNRRRRGLSLRQRLLTTSPQRETVHYQASNLLRKAEKVGKSTDVGTLILAMPHAVSKWLDDHGSYLEALTAITARKIEINDAAQCDAYIKSSQ